MKYKAIIFDLDDVVVSTNNCHYEPCGQLAGEEGIYFDRTISERFRNVNRMESLETVLDKGVEVALAAAMEVLANV